MPTATKKPPSCEPTAGCTSSTPYTPRCTLDSRTTSTHHACLPSSRVRVPQPQVTPSPQGLLGLPAAARVPTPRTPCLRCAPCIPLTTTIRCTRASLRCLRLTTHTCSTHHSPRCPTPCHRQPRLRDPSPTLVTKPPSRLTTRPSPSSRPLLPSCVSADTRLTEHLTKHQHQYKAVFASFSPSLLPP